MIKGIGVDIWSVKEMQALLDQQAPFLRDHFTPKELAEATSKVNPAQSLAARYAAKEAAIKALGHTSLFGPKGIQNGVNYLDIEVLNDPDGVPYLIFTGIFSEVCESNGVKQSFVTMSHHENTAIAYVIFEG